MKIQKENSLLVVIDMQDFILKLIKNATPYSTQQVIDKNEKLIDCAEKLAIPVAFITVTKKILPQKWQEKMTKLAIKSDLIAHENGNCYTKYKPSAYTIPEFRAFLEKNNIETIILSGIITSNGVRNTARDLLTAGYKVIIIVDAMTDRSKKAHDNAIAELESLGASSRTAHFPFELAQGSKEKICHQN
ncbi:isochorismatase [Lactococcus hodotermopsidis]|uniref:Isochorismatase n=1 Tax=Pseudolactococcus hodotermopsidis TaxID=2709157 RepID=A0A6A0BDK1_9LACT|nr:cysteine hydrolase [Lactococcus hodotermopsidis]GFH42886.1 isochorismatase [Lactococcus hodotermopsidis]